MSEVQSIVFEKKLYSLEDAKKWLKKEGYKTDPDIKPTQYRFRQREPKNYKRFTTKKIKNGLNFILGYK